MNKSIDGLIGLAIGDALGVPAEFTSREELKKDPVTGMRGYGSHNVPAGAWSDDTSMTIAAMDAVAKSGTFDYKAIMDNFVKYIGGDYTPTGIMFDIGFTCRNAIVRYARDHYEPTESGEDGERSNGNGSLMRCLPVPLYCHAHGMNVDLKLSNRLSALTHRHEISRLGCYIYSNYAWFILDGCSKTEAYEKMQKADYSMFSDDSIKAYARVLYDKIYILPENAIKSSGYVVDTLEAALWCVMRCESFEDTVLTAVNLGDDTDTVGAVAGALAGLIYGYEAIPKEWLNTLIERDYLEMIAKAFDNRMQGELELHVSPVEKQESTDEFILTPSPVEKQPESFDLTLEAESVAKAEEITFDGKAESEARIEEAMRAYDKAMDEAAGIK